MSEKFTGGFDMDNDKRLDIGEKDFSTVFYTNMEGDASDLVGAIEVEGSTPWYVQTGPPSSVPLDVCMATRVNEDTPEKGTIYGAKLNKYPDVDTLVVMVNNRPQIKSKYLVEGLVCWMRHWLPGDGYDLHYREESWEQRARRTWK